jgi:Protein of unknown function (Hypoth_ymh)
MSGTDFGGAVARLQGLRASLPMNMDAVFVQSHFASDYEGILKSLRAASGDVFANFDLPRDAFRNTSHSGIQVRCEAVRSKCNQLAAYLEEVHSSADQVIAIGSVYNLIRDGVLKSRCADLLSLSGHFDRVINQATQVLEERIREKFPEFTTDFGLPLVGKAMNAEPAKSRTKFSDNPSEQEGYVSIFRGLIGAFRNPSHHRFLENVTREQALQICAFIDNMLAALESAEIANA